MKDAELAKRLRARDPEAVKEMIGRHGDRLMATAYLMCGSEAEAQDHVALPCREKFKIS